VFKSIDGGDSWQPLNNGLTNLSVSALAIDPKQPGTVYAAASSNPDAFVAKLNPDGGLVYSTYLGGSSYESAKCDRRGRYRRRLYHGYDDLP